MAEFSHFRLGCVIISCGCVWVSRAWSHKTGVQNPASIPTAINTTLAFIRGAQGTEVADLRFVHNESSMCVFGWASVCVCVSVSKCLINKALGRP